MTPATEMARLFADIPRPESLSPIDPVEADEANFGPCALGEEHDQ